MANTSSGTPGNTAVPKHGDHDRVAMLSLRADGTPDQHDPEIIGDKEFALEATQRQFAEQAVSAVDATERANVGLGVDAEEVKQDPSVADLQKRHDAAAKAAESAAKKTVDQLYKRDDS